MFHTITLCEEIADRMRDPKHVLETMEEQYKRYGSPELFWTKDTLMDGYPGIACFYGMMDRIFPNERWADVTHEYMKETAILIEEKGFDSPSLFSGLTGVCFSLAFCSDYGKRYQRVLEKLEDLLIEKINECYIQEGKRHIDNGSPLPSTFYNLSDGISGILGYALLRKENARLYATALESAKTLILLFQRPLENGTLPRWYLSPEHQFNDEERVKYPEGSFILNMPFGVAGCLSALSLLKINGIDLPGLHDVIQTLSLWLQSQGRIDNGVYHFDNTVPLKGSVQNELPRDTWWCGVPAVAHAIFKAGKATHDLKMQKYGEEAMISMFSKSTKDWNHIGTSFVHGRAGILTTTYRMAEATENPTLWKEVKELEADLISFYRPNSPFGFESVYVDDFGEYHWVNNPGILYGASGVALALMLAQNREELDWDRAFLLR